MPDHEPLTIEAINDFAEETKRVLRQLNRLEQGEVPTEEEIRQALREAINHHAAIAKLGVNLDAARYLAEQQAGSRYVRSLV